MTPYPYTFERFAEFIAAGRNKRDRPLANNTRARYIDADTIAVHLHATDVVIYHRDGRVQLNSGGWRTVTTADRIRGHSNAKLGSEDGVWYISLAPNPEDPKPDWPRRTVLKPFHALDPGPEPVKSDEGCIAGTETVREYDEEHLISEHDLGPLTGWTEDDIVRPYEHDSDYFIGYVMRHRRDVTAWGANRWGEAPTTGIGGRGYYKQCPHCELFDRQHEAWSLAYNGEHWGRNRHKGFRQMTAALELHGSREAWHDAYIEDFRRVRDGRREYRAWTDRNRVMFEDMMEIDSDGYAPAANPNQADTLAVIEQQRKRINEFVRFVIGELKSGMPMPGAGDCWYCSMTQVPDGTPMGDAMPTLHEDGTVTIQPSHHHLIDHMDENYAVPSLIVNAMRERGYKDVGIYMLLDMNQETQTMGGRGDYKSIARDLRTYLTARLVPQAAGPRRQVA